VPGFSLGVDCAQAAGAAGFFELFLAWLVDLLDLCDFDDDLVDDVSVAAGLAAAGVAAAGAVEAWAYAPKLTAEATSATRRVFMRNSLYELG